MPREYREKSSFTIASSSLIGPLRAWLAGMPFHYDDRNIDLIPADRGLGHPAKPMMLIKPHRVQGRLETYGTGLVWSGDLQRLVQ